MNIQAASSCYRTFGGQIESSTRRRHTPLTTRSNHILLDSREVCVEIGVSIQDVKLFILQPFVLMGSILGTECMFVGGAEEERDVGMEREKKRGREREGKRQRGQR